MKLPLASLILILAMSLTARAGLDRHPGLVVADAPGHADLPARGVRITYLGTNGWLLEARDGAVLIDPYFTRAGILAAALNLRVRPDIGQVESALRRLPARVDAIVITHGHFDHLLDAPRVAGATRATLIASQSSVWLANAAGLHPRKTAAVAPGGRWRRGALRIRALAASHDRVLGRVPFDRHLAGPPPPPRRIADWVCGEPLAFLIELGGQRIYVDSGGTMDVLPPRDLGRIDLAILGVALPDSRRRLGPALDRLRPRFFLPSHQDNFFRPLERGFSFNWLTSFPAVRREAARHPVRLILLDYFTPWTLR